ncbi:hypothetical protein DFJ43DRAFT_1149967 [Lentinula guzmanii]|uniref:Uncharacterized protein n=1 Tax=Lentinula guzmanii TaxID=2804957 RepID=A0AA38JWD3_9AGAR|nr:hypothetical protein DFJ43DRAFT_1149967 [Lentinula guzmanii]
MYNPVFTDIPFFICDSPVPSNDLFCPDATKELVFMAIVTVFLLGLVVIMMALIEGVCFIAAQAYTYLAKYNPCDKENVLKRREQAVVLRELAVNRQERTLQMDVEIKCVRAGESVRVGNRKGFTFGNSGLRRRHFWGGSLIHRMPKSPIRD